MGVAEKLWIWVQVFEQYKGNQRDTEGYQYSLFLLPQVISEIGLAWFTMLNRNVLSLFHLRLLKKVCMINFNHIKQLKLYFAMPKAPSGG